MPLKERVDNFNYLADAYKEIDPKESIEIGRRALEVARKINYAEGIFYAFNNLGTAFEDIGEKDSSFWYLDQALPIAVDLDDDYAISVIKNNLGLFYLYRGNYSLALKYFQESLDKLDRPGPFIDAVETYNNIGVIHEEQQNFEKAKTYYLKVAEISEVQGDSAYASLSYGYIEYLEENYPKAILFYEEALEHYRKQGDQIRTGESLFYIGEAHWRNKNLELARQFLLESLSVYQRLGLLYDEVEIYLLLADLSEEEGKYDEALETYSKAATMAGKSELNTLLVPIYQSLADLYARKNDFRKAYQYQKQYQSLNDTIFNNETKEHIAQLESSYALEMSKTERERLQAEQAGREATVVQRTILAIGSTLVAFLVAIIAGIFYRANQQKKILNKKLENKVKDRTMELETVNEELVTTNKELERFMYIASHDLKEPLRNINSFVNLIQRRMGSNTDDELKEYMGFVTANTRRMYTLIDDVLAFSRIAALDKNTLEWLDLNEEMTEIQATLGPLLQAKNVVLEIADLPRVKAQKSHIFMVFKNLIENGIKYNETESPRLQIGYTTKNDFYCFFVIDNGIGIDFKYHDQIFEMFKRMNTREKYEGTGIGLAICKKIVGKYGGKIGVESEEGEGSRFYFTWPRN